MTGSLVAADGTSLAWYRRDPSGRTPRSVAVLVHGLGEHVGRHGELVAHLVRAGIAVVGADLRGHGRSGGPRGHVARFDDYLDDLGLVVSAARQSPRGAPLWLVGHSLGALIVLRLVEQRRVPGLAGIVLSAIGIDPILPVPAWKRLLGRVGAWLAPRLPVDAGIRARMLSRDPAVQDRYDGDPLVHRVATPGWYREFEAARRDALAGAARVSVPVLLVHGEADPIASVEGSRRLAGALTGADVTLRVYPGARHEVFTDPECGDAPGDVERWMLDVERRRLRRAS